MKKTLQLFADLIIRKLKNAKNDEVFESYYELGMIYNDFCINYFNIYLD